MGVQLRELHKQAANSTDYPCVHVCFEDPGITYLFAHLLESRGIDVVIVENLSALNNGMKVVTEPRILRKTEIMLSEEDLLIVGNDGSLHGLNGVLLVQPLTEEKVESALDTFLTAPDKRSSSAQ